MNSERRQALILAAGWAVMAAFAAIGLAAHEALTLSASGAVVFVGLHFLLLGSRGVEPSSDELPVNADPVTAEPAEKRHEETERARLTERRLAHLAELADVGLVQSSHAGEIEFASSRARQLLDIGEDLTPSDAWRQAFAAMQLRFSPSSTSTGAVQIHTTSGPSVLTLKAHPVEDEGWHGYLVQVRDRRLLDALESDLRFASRLRVLNRLYLGVAHDLKGPLNAIMLTLESLRADIVQGTSETHPHVARLDVVREELTRHHRSLETLLAQTAPERLDRQTFDLRTVVNHVGRLIHPQLRHQRIELEIGGSEAAFVHAIQDRIREALLALVVNAMEAMPGGGRLSLTTTHRDRFCVIEVRDSGAGIADEIRDRIFDFRFTTRDTGTGIGLSTARSIVESEHGTIEVTETGDSGSTFRITLPAAGAE